MSVFTLAAAQYEIGFLRNWQEYETKVTRMVNEASEADLLVFPEYFSLELASLFEKDVQQSLGAQLDRMQSLHEPFKDLYRQLALRRGVTIVAGTFPVRLPEGSYVNRAWVFTPDGAEHFQDKVQMTRFEAEEWLISGGRDIKVIPTPQGKVGIAICYDAEFPLIVRRMVEMGAEFILVPSCTDGEAGFHRVRIGCQARALENQCYVVQSPTVGSAPWSPAVDENYGAAAIYTPPDRGFPANGILAVGPLNLEAWVTARLDLEQTRAIRWQGQVLNHRDWSRQGESVTAELP